MAMISRMVPFLVALAVARRIVELRSLTTYSLIRSVRTSMGSIVCRVQQPLLRESRRILRFACEGKIRQGTISAGVGPQKFKGLEGCGVGGNELQVQQCEELTEPKVHEEPIVNHIS